MYSYVVAVFVDTSIIVILVFIYNVLFADIWRFKRPNFWAVNIISPWIEIIFPEQISEYNILKLYK